MTGEMWVEVVFMLLVLKIPAVYLCLVVWWAIRAEPRPLEGAAAPARLAPPDQPCPWRRGRRVDPCRPGSRGPARHVAVGRARAAR